MECELRRILITGGSGQDGQILATQLLNEGLQVSLTCRRNALEEMEFLFEGSNSRIVPVDLSCEIEIDKILEGIKPSLIFNLAGFSSVIESWENPISTFKVNTNLPSQILKWIVAKSPETRMVQASSSEIFGGSNRAPQNEKDLLSPITPYGFSKAAAHQMVRSYREKYNIHASSSILYNHESPLRHEKYVTRKISNNVAKIKLGLIDKFDIGNIDAIRDWGWAPDYTKGMILSSISDTPEDFVFSTGIKHSVADILKVAFATIGVSDYQQHISVSSNQMRVIDPAQLVGNSIKAKSLLNWEPCLSFQKTIELMVEADILRLSEPDKRKTQRNILKEISLNQVNPTFR
jgi:GDPmannose 4,6-dehydratase